MRGFIVLLVIVSFTPVMGCGSEEPASTAPAAPAVPEAPAAPAAPAVPTAPAGGLQINGPPQALAVPPPPGFVLNATEAGEYQIDATGQPMDAQLYIYQGNEAVADDSDSGDSTNARIIRFLQPGAYSVRVYEYRARPMSAQVQAQLLTPMTL